MQATGAAEGLKPATSLVVETAKAQVTEAAESLRRATSVVVARGQVIKVVEGLNQAT